MEWVTTLTYLRPWGLSIGACTVSHQSFDTSSLQTRNSTPALTPYAYLDIVPQISVWLPSSQDSGFSWGVPHHNGFHLLLSPSHSLRVPAS